MIIQTDYLRMFDKEGSQVSTCKQPYDPGRWGTAGSMLSLGQ